MKIVVKKVGCEPEVREIENELHTIQEIVGGYIQCFNVVHDIVCVCDEEGKLKDYPPNFIFNDDIIAGDVLFCKAGEEDFESLSDEQIEFIMNALYVFEVKNK